MSATTVRMLRDISYFANMSDHDLRQVAAITAEKRYPAGAVIIAEQTEAERFFIVHRGKIEVSKKFEDTEEFVLAVYSDGDFFGEMALLDEGRRSATVRAIEPTTALEISRKDFETLLYKAPRLAYGILKELSSRLRETGALLISYLKQRNRQLYRAYISTMSVVAEALERKALETRGYVLRARILAKSLGREMNLPDGHLLMLELAALLHDLGVNEGPGASAEEGAGPEASSPADKQGGAPLLENVIATILRRHEKGEGSAYPEGFAGSDIPRIDKIVAVADGFARLTRGAPEDRVPGVDAALAEMLGDSSGRYDPEAVLALQRLQEKGNLAELL